MLFHKKTFEILRGCSILPAMYTHVCIEKMKRLAGFPYPVETIGQLHHLRTVPAFHLYTKLEVCLRLSGNDGYAVDKINGQDFHTPYPHVMFKKPGLQHSFHAKDHREAVFFIYSEETTKRLMSLDLLPDYFLQPLTLTGELKNLLQRLSSLIAISENISSADKIDLACFAILEELLFQRNIKSNSIQSKIREIASLIQMDSEDNPNIRRIAADNGFSERSFYRHWKKVFSISPARYVMAQKMKRAAWLLTRSHMQIGEIAIMLHFCDDNSFSSTFRHFYGMTPREYRKQNSSS